MFMKHVMVFFIFLAILGYFYADHIFFWQGDFMVRMQYDIAAYDAYERVVKYYPNSKFARQARENMTKLRGKSGDLSKSLQKKEVELKKEQEKREKTESFR
jgi:outer membrane protein assembly factor BamD (BamD/ComL family)